MSKNTVPLREKLEALQAALSRHPHLLRIGRMFSATVLVEAGTAQCVLVFEKGRLAHILDRAQHKDGWHFALRTDREALDTFWHACPPPGFHDVFALVKTGRARIEGDMLLLLKNLRFFKEFLALGRTERAL